MTKKTSSRKNTAKIVSTFKHETDTRRNIPTAEFQSFMQGEEQKPKELRYPRNTDLDPQLVWRGKAPKVVRVPISPCLRRESVFVVPLKVSRGRSLRRISATRW